MSATATAPRIETTFVGKRHCVCVTARDLANHDVLEELHKARRGLVRVPFNISGQVLHARQAKLAASASSPAVNVSLDVDSHRVAISSRDLVDTLIPQLLNLKRVRLERIAVPVFRHKLYDATTVAELTHFAGAPCVKVTFFRCVLQVISEEEIKIIVAIASECLEFFETTAFDGRRIECETQFGLHGLELTLR